MLSNNALACQACFDLRPWPAIFTLVIVIPEYTAYRIDMDALLECPPFAYIHLDVSALIS